VTMRHHNLFQLELVLLKKSEDLRDVVARIDDHRFAAGLVAKHGAVALQRSDRKRCEDHGVRRYFFAGTLCVVPDNTEWWRVDWCCSITVNVIDVRTNTTASHVVALVSTFEAERGPNAVCEPWPPNAAARSALLPCCNRMMRISVRLTMTWIAITRIITVVLLNLRARPNSG
jgi:hypothetical protein